MHVCWLPCVQAYKVGLNSNSITCFIYSFYSYLKNIIILYLAGQQYQHSFVRNLTPKYHPDPYYSLIWVQHTPEWNQMNFSWPPIQRWLYKQHSSNNGILLNLKALRSLPSHGLVGKWVPMYCISVPISQYKFCIIILWEQCEWQIVGSHCKKVSFLVLFRIAPNCTGKS